MAELSRQLDVRSVLADLVEQFADPLAFYRELVQNAIDAGTGRVEITFEYDDSEAGRGAGRMTISVRDYGEGMDREVIEQEFLRLFSSGKDRDYTKIGRFGIGFVSVFGIDPEVVCVDTGRSGEYWRLLFDESRTFELVRLDEPIEGTDVRLYKSVTREEYERIRKESREVVATWCKHASVPVLVEGTDVREPFEVDAPISVGYEEEGTRLRLGLVAEREAPFGYYNRGLMLEEGAGNRWPHVAVKLDSRYIEHTVSRDEVVEDENFHEAEALVEDCIRGALPRRLLDEIERSAAVAAEQSSLPPPPYATLAGLLATYLAEYGEPASGWRDRELVPVAGGERRSLAQLESAHGEGRLLLGGARHRATASLGSYTLVEVRGTSTGLVRLLSRALGEVPPAIDERFVTPARVEPYRRDEADRLCEELARHLRNVDAEPSSLDFAVVDREAPVREDVAFITPAGGETTPFDELRDLERANIGGRHLWLNFDHEVVRRALAVAGRRPRWAAYHLAKVLCAGELVPEEDLTLVRQVLSRRPDREGGDG